MIRLIRNLLLAFLIMPSQGFAADCELEAQLREVQIQNCGGDLFLGTSSKDGSLVNPVRLDVIPVGLEKFWSDLCRCDLWQVSGIAGAHTHVVRFFRIEANGSLTLIPGGEFSSEIGKISRVIQTSGFTVEIRDSDVSGMRKTWERYRFDGKKFSKIRTT